MAAGPDSGDDIDIAHNLRGAFPRPTDDPQLLEFGEYRTVASGESGSYRASGAAVSKRYAIARLVLEFIIGAWLSYCSIRYVIAAVVYHDDGIRFGLAMSFAIVSIIATAAIGLIIVLEFIVGWIYARCARTPRTNMKLKKGYFYDSVVFMILIATASVILIAICLANIILASVLRRPSDLAHPDTYGRAIQGRCTWDVDVIWTGTGMACGNGIHIWSIYLVAAILRLIVTAAVLMFFAHLARRAKSKISLERPSRPSKIKHTRSSSMLSFFSRRPRNNTVSSGAATSTVTTALTSPPLGASDDLDVARVSPIEEQDRNRIVSFSFGSGHYPSSPTSGDSSRTSSVPASPTSSSPRSRRHRRSLSIDSTLSPSASEPFLWRDTPILGSRPVIPPMSVSDILDPSSQSPRTSPRKLRAVDAEFPVTSPTRDQRRYNIRSPAGGSPRQSLQVLSSRAKARPIVQILGGDVEKMSTIESVSSQDQIRSGRISGTGGSEVDSLSSLGQWIPPTLGPRDWNEGASRSSSSSPPPSPPWSR